MLTDKYNNGHLGKRQDHQEVKMPIESQINSQMKIYLKRQDIKRNRNNLFMLLT
jgi:hypothetical protein